MKKKITTRLVSSLGPENKPYEVFDTEVKGFILRIEPSGVMTYYLAYKNQQELRRRFRIGGTGNLKVAQARDLAEKFAGQVANGSDPQEDRVKSRGEAKKRKSNTLCGFIKNEYEPWAIEHLKSGKSDVQRVKFNFGDYLDRPLTDISPWIVSKWKTNQLKAGKSKATINRDITALRAILAKAIQWDFISTDPLEGLESEAVDKKPKVRYLSAGEEERLRSALSKRDLKIKSERSSANEWRIARGYELLPDLTSCVYSDHLTPMVLLSLNTGLRRGEVFSLTWDNVNFHINQITIEGHTAKNDTTRHIPLNKEAKGVLKDWREQTRKEGLVFPGKNGGKLNNVRKSWAGLLTAANILDFRWHDQRHDFASKLVMRGVPLNTVRELMGHSDMNTTLIYAHLAPEHHAEAVAKLREV